MSYAKCFLSVSVAMLLATTACAGASVSSSAPAEYLCWLEELKEEMIDRGILTKIPDMLNALFSYLFLFDNIVLCKKHITMLSVFYMLLMQLLRNDRLIVSAYT